MEKLKINSVSAVLGIVGASFYAIGLIVAFTIQYYLQFLSFMSILVMLIWYFSLAASILLLIAFIKTKKAKMRTIGPLVGMFGHLLYFIFGIYLAPMSIILCILSTYYIFKDNGNVIAKGNEVIDIEAIDVSSDDIID